MPDIAFQILDEAAQLPARAHATDAGWDVTSIEKLTLAPGERAGVRTGLAMQLPADWCCLVVPRSGLALKGGISIVNAPGLIDAGFRGEVRVILINTSQEPFEVNPGDRIGQFVFMPVPQVKLHEVQDLTDSDRGQGGFGSSGR